MKRCGMWALALSVQLLLVARVLAGTCTWIGSVSTNWAEPGNWSALPGSGDDVVIASTNPYAPVCFIAAGSTQTLASVSLGQGATNVTLTLAGLGTLATTGDFHIGAKGVLTHGDNPINAAVAQNKLTVFCANFTMDGGSWINVDNRGFKGTNGPAGAPNRASNQVAGGGSYGGLGGGTGRKGDDSPDTYGSPFQPTDLGCGSANPTNVSGVAVGGGGAVHIAASGTATLNGTIAARGTNTLYGGGSGGSIWIEAATMTGSGTNRADGANGNGSNGGGGGGRIALNYSTASGFTPVISATPGTGGTFHLAELGTLYVPASFFPADLVVTKTLYALATNYAFNSLTISNAVLEFCANSGSVTTVTIANNLILTNGAALLLRGDRHTTYGSGGAIVAGSIFVSTNSSINADGKGFRNGQGPGCLISAAMNGGGSHGGDGGNASGGNAVPHGLCYGSLTQPTALGSSGGGYRGYGILNATVNSVAGGALQITVCNTFALNGRCSADGLNGSGGYGGGSGGSLWIMATNLTGTGTFSAQGGPAGSDSGYQGGGGGGRVAIYAGNRTGFTGAMRVDGAVGAGSLSGRPGTLYLPDFYTPPGIAWTVTNSIALAPGTSYFTTLTVTNGAYLDCQSDPTVRGDSPSALTNYGKGVTIVAQNIVVAPNSYIYADGQGFCASNGPGHGAQGGYNKIYNCGGSYGGLGGNFGTLYGGECPTYVTYGSSNQPTALGSGAGFAGSSNTCSHGGGAVRLNVSKDLVVNGTITANGVCNGNSGSVNYYSGGSGGSIWISAVRLLGQGVIQANGGTNGNSTGGGGGGGRIAIYYTNPTASFPTGAVGCLTLSVAALMGGANSTTNGYGGTIYVNKMPPSGTSVFFR